MGAKLACRLQVSNSFRHRTGDIHKHALRVGLALHLVPLFMTNWPSRIPFDLHAELESRRTDDWQKALRAWAKVHGLKLKIQWWRQLERAMADLHSRRYVAGPQDHWAAIEEWLERHDVPAPEQLPEWPEQESATNY